MFYQSKVVEMDYDSKVGRNLRIDLCFLGILSRISKSKVYSFKNIDVYGTEKFLNTSKRGGERQWKWRTKKGMELEL